MERSKLGAEVRRLAKRANQRMVELERHNLNTPAYKAAQATLEMMGRKSVSAKGRRFSETGRGNYNELEQQKAELEKFLGHETSTVRGFKTMQDRIYATADKDGSLTAAGITKDEYFELFDEVPNKISDRLYYATFYVQVLQTYQMKIKEGGIVDEDGEVITEENALSITDLVRILQGTSNLKSALTEIGISVEDIKATRKRLYGDDKK